MSSFRDSFASLDGTWLPRAFSEIPKGLPTLLEAIPCGLFTIDADGRINGWNEHMVRLTGYLAEEVARRRCTVLDGSACNEGPCLESGNNRCSLFLGEPVRDKRCRIRRKDGTWVTVLKNADLLYDDAGDLVGAIEVITDLSNTLALQEEVARLRSYALGRARFGRLVGRHPSMTRLYDIIEMAGRTPCSVLVLGETGTGKELVARAIHESSSRRDGPFIRVSCGALSETVLESELFGHVKGAFTGAIADRVGRFEAANGGTIFLDEIGDISLATQARLLRVLQEHEFERVGDTRTIKVDIRVVAATHRDLVGMSSRGDFREDLYYRLAVIPMEVPPLRERRSDIPLLVDHFIELTNTHHDRAVTTVAPATMERLMEHEWPGNVRELQHAVEYGFVLSRGSVLQEDCLPPNIGRTRAARPSTAPAPRRRGERPDAGTLRAALEAAGGNRTEAARQLGVSRVTLWKWLKASEVEHPTG